MLRLLVNGEERQVEAAAGRSLLSVLREELRLTGAKYGCGEGQCGACTVLVDGQALPACITTAEEVAGRPILTVEGLEQNGQLHPLQEAFLDCEAFQCGYCTPGMLMAALGLLRRNPTPSDRAIAQALQGNLCRCGAYTRIVNAIQEAAATLRSRELMEVGR